MSETKTATGVKQGITEKSGGWFSIEIALPGKEYPLKLDTKKQELVELARAAGENVMEWKYTETDSGTPNPHRPGSNFINRHFEGVAPPSPDANVSPSTAAPSGTGEEKLSKDEWALKDRAADLRACIAIVSGALQHTVKSEPSDEDLNEYARRVLHVARQFHNVVQFERSGEPDPF